MTRLFEGKLIAKCSDANLCSAQALQIGSIAQLVQSICLTSRGSGVRIPLLPQRSKTAIGRLFHLYFDAQSTAHYHGSIAQLVQSICLTSRGSGVRIPLLPQRMKTTSGRLFCFMWFNAAGQRTFGGGRRRVGQNNYLKAGYCDCVVNISGKVQEITDARFSSRSSSHIFFGFVFSLLLNMK